MLSIRTRPAATAPLCAAEGGTSAVPAEVALRYGLVGYLDKFGSKSSGELVSDANFLEPYGDRFLARPRVHCHPVKAELTAAKRMFPGD
jgi:hypothetical protein